VPAGGGESHAEQHQRPEGEPEAVGRDDGQDRQRGQGAQDPAAERPLQVVRDDGVPLAVGEQDREHAGREQQWRRDEPGLDQHEQGRGHEAETEPDRALQGRARADDRGDQEELRGRHHR